MLPDVGSTMVPPGFSSPLASAASIIFTAMRSLAAAARVEVLDLGDHLARALGDDRVQLNQRGIADELTDVPGDPHTSIVSGRENGYQVASRM